ncbi:hypothetical protein DEO72_LG8g587 [Vigna unguiculata]|uniref:Uncharacterized protein n=1 Tax=Vigna unguiculata TaxID=3917 RepID=A0A4D6MPP2_VIGUN|nr:hypothetical protein DEO72_LG8g587 [Vigna unguiculata]
MTTSVKKFWLLKFSQEKCKTFQESKWCLPVIKLKSLHKQYGESLASRGYHPTTHKWFLPKLEDIAHAKGLFSPERGSKQRTTQTLSEFSLKLSCLA